MTGWQNGGSAEITTTSRLEALGVDATGRTSFGYFTRINVVSGSATASGLDFWHRLGANATPALALRRRFTQGDIAAIINTLLGSTTLSFGYEPQDGDNLAFGLCWVGTGLNLTDHPDAVASAYLAAYLLDCDNPSADPIVVSSAAANLAGTLASRTALRIESDLNASVHALDEAFLVWGDAPSKAEFLAWARRELKATRCGVSLAGGYHWWLLRRKGSAQITGSDAELADLSGSADMTIPAAGPVWRDTTIPPVEDENNDQVYAYEFGEPTVRNAGVINTAYAQNKGVRHVRQVDSFGRADVLERGAAAFKIGLHTRGYTITARQGYIRLGSNFTEGVLNRTLTNVTRTWRCNASLGAGYLTQPDGFSTRYGLPMGGFAEFKATGAPTLHTNNELLPIYVNADLMGSGVDYFGDGDPLEVLVCLPVPTSNYFDGTIRVTTPAGNTDIDTTATDVWRQFPQDDATWSDILNGVGGERVADHCNFYKDWISLGSSGDSREISFRIPTLAEFASGENVFVGCPVVRKVDGNGDWVKGQYDSSLGDNSGFFQDAWESSLPTSDGQKEYTDEQVSRWLAATTIDPTQPHIFEQWYAFERYATLDRVEAIDAWIARCRKICTDAGITGDVYFVFMGHQMHTIVKDTLENDRDLHIQWHEAALEVAAREPHFCYIPGGEYQRWAMLADEETMQNSSGAYTERGYSELEFARTDPVLSTRITQRPGLDNIGLHLGSYAAAEDLVEWALDEIEAAPVIVDGDSPGSLRRPTMNRRKLRPTG